MVARSTLNSIYSSLRTGQPDRSETLSNSGDIGAINPSLMKERKGSALARDKKSNAQVREQLDWRIMGNNGKRSAEAWLSWGLCLFRRILMMTLVSDELDSRTLGLLQTLLKCDYYMRPRQHAKSQRFYGIISRSLIIYSRPQMVDQKQYMDSQSQRFPTSFRLR